MPRPPLVPTEAQRSTVKSLAAYGIKQEDIATEVGLRSPKTLRKHFAQEIKRAATQANARVAQTLFKLAISGEDVAATIFWLKTRAGWRENQIVEIRSAATPDFIVAQEKEAA